MDAKQIQHIDTLRALRTRQFEALQKALKLRHISLGSDSKDGIERCRNIIAVIRALDEALNNMILDASKVEMLEALRFYADPFTYYAIFFFPDYPAGALMDDFSETEELEAKPGKLARDVLARMAALIAKPDEACCSFIQRDNVERDCMNSRWNICKLCSRHVEGTEEKD